MDPPGVAYLAKRLALRITDIWEVATFYSMIYTEPIWQIITSGLPHSVMQNHGARKNRPIALRNSASGRAGLQMVASRCLSGMPGVVAPPMFRLILTP